MFILNEGERTEIAEYKGTFYSCVVSESKGIMCYRPMPYVKRNRERIDYDVWKCLDDANKVKEFDPAWQFGNISNFYHFRQYMKLMYDDMSILFDMEVLLKHLKGDPNFDNHKLEMLESKFNLTRRHMLFAEMDLENFYLRTIPIDWAFSMFGCENWREVEENVFLHQMARGNFDLPANDKGMTREKIKQLGLFSAVEETEKFLWLNNAVTKNK